MGCMFVSMKGCQVQLLPKQPNPTLSTCCWSTTENPPPSQVSLQEGQNTFREHIYSLQSNLAFFIDWYLDMVGPPCVIL